MTLRYHPSYDVIIPILCLTVLLGWLHPDAFAICLLSLGTLTLLKVLMGSKPKCLCFVDSAVRLLEVWSFVFATGSTLTIIADCAPVKVSQRLGWLMVDGHLGWSPLLIIPLAVLLLRTFDDAQGLLRMAKRFIYVTKWTQHSAIDADLMASEIDFAEAQCRRRELQCQEDFLEMACGLLEKVGAQIKLCLWALGVSLGGAIVLRMLVLGQSWGAVLSDSVPAIVGQCLLLTANTFVISSSVGLTMASHPWCQQLLRKEQGRLPQREETLRVLATVSAEVAMSRLGLPLGLALLLQSLCRRRH